MNSCKLIFKSYLNSVVETVNDLEPQGFFHQLSANSPVNSNIHICSIYV